MRTETEYQIAVCQALGWRDIKTRPGFGNRLTGRFGLKDYVLPIPPLTLDLMHEAEETLTESQWMTYISNLGDVTQTDYRKDETKNGSRIHATAIQRAEAFLRVKGMA